MLVLGQPVKIAAMEITIFACPGQNIVVNSLPQHLCGELLNL